jgi:hypothetical protein
VQFNRARTESSRSHISSPVLWYWLPMADVPLPLGFQTVPCLSYSNSWLNSGLSRNSSPILISSKPLLRGRVWKVFSCCWTSPGKSFETPPTKFKFKLSCDQRSVGQSVLVSGPLWGPRPDFSFLCLTITLFLLHVRRPLWREYGSVICSEITHWLQSRSIHNHILQSYLRLPEPRGPGPRIYIRQ